MICHPLRKLVAIQVCIGQSLKGHIQKQPRNLVDCRIHSEPRSFHRLALFWPRSDSTRSGGLLQPELPLPHFDTTTTTTIIITTIIITTIIHTIINTPSSFNHQSSTDLNHTILYQDHQPSIYRTWTNLRPDLGQGLEIRALGYPWSDKGSPVGSPYKWPETLITAYNKWSYHPILYNWYRGPPCIQPCGRTFMTGEEWKNTRRIHGINLPNRILKSAKQFMPDTFHPLWNCWITPIRSIGRLYVYHCLPTLMVVVYGKCR